MSEPSLSNEKHFNDLEISDVLRLFEQRRQESYPDLIAAADLSDIVCSILSWHGAHDASWWTKCRNEFVNAIVSQSPGTDDDKTLFRREAESMISENPKRLIINIKPTFFLGRNRV